MSAVARIAGKRGKKPRPAQHGAATLSHWVGWAAVSTGRQGGWGSAGRLRHCRFPFGLSDPSYSRARKHLCGLALQALMQSKATQDRRQCTPVNDQQCRGPNHGKAGIHHQSGGDGPTAQNTCQQRNPVPANTPTGRRANRNWVRLLRRGLRAFSARRLHSDGPVCPCRGCPINTRKPGQKSSRPRRKDVAAAKTR